MGVERIHIVNLGYVLMVINLLLFLARFRNANRAMRLFTLYLFVIAVIQFGSSYMSRHHMNNLFLSHFYFILQFILLGFFYLSFLKDGIQRRFVRVTMAGCLVLLGLQYYLDPMVFSNFNLFEIFLTSFLIVIYALFHFYNILNESHQYYWLNTGIFIYIFVSSVLFLSGNLMSSIAMQYVNLVWTLNGILYIVYQVFIFLEWWKGRRPRVAKGSVK